MDPINFPLLGNSLVMALFILVHVFFAFVAVGGISIALATEWLGLKGQRPFHDRFARGYISFLSEMMKLGGVLGVAIVVLLVGLFPRFTSLLYNVFFWPLMLEVALFFIMMAAVIYYRRSWEGARSRARHMAGGAIAAIAAIASALVINAAHAFMLTPGNYFETKGLLDAILNPTMLVSATHLLIPCFANAAAFAFIYAMWRGRAAEARDAEYISWMKGYAGRIFAGAILLQPLSGLSFLLKVKGANEAIYANITGGAASRFFWPMVGLGVIAVTSSLIFWLSRTRARGVLLVGALAALTAFSFGGYTRERARKPYLIYGHMYMNEGLAAAAPAKASDGGTPRDLLSRRGCLACHRFKGEGGTFGPPLDLHLRHHSKDELKRFLASPPAGMPPFAGTAEELERFIEGITR